MFKWFRKREVRRYNFIVGQSCVYSGLFTKVGLFGGKELRRDIANKRRSIARNYRISERAISVSNTVK